MSRAVPPLPHIYSWHEAEVNIGTALRLRLPGNPLITAMLRARCLCSYRNYYAE